MSIAIDGMEEIIKEFLVESGEGLDLLDRDLVALERDPSSRELLAEIFRAVHTIKGTSGVLGFPKLESIAHVGENLLSRMRDGKLVLNPAITSGLLAMVDALRQLLREVEQRGQEGHADFGDVVRLLDGLLQQPEAAPVCTSAAAIAGVPNLPAPIEASPARGASSASSPAAAAEDMARESAIAGSKIRVDVGLLDQMMNLVGELVLARNQILQCSSSQSDATFCNAAQRLNLITIELQEAVMRTRLQPIGNVWNRFPRLVRDLALQCGKQVTLEMEGSETELDKTIIEAIKDPLTHILRNAIDHGIEGSVERVGRGKSPAGHLQLRAYHEGGQVNIEINDDGGGIHVEHVKQQALGRGIVNTRQLAGMSDRDLMNLVFLPGFSTAEKVSNVSGRGVGLDVVKTNIERIGGTVDLQSVSGQGTTLKIKIPLTLAIIPALIVSSGGERFAIPQVSLVELVCLDGADGAAGIEHIQNVPVYRLRGRLLPLVFLSAELRLQGRDERQHSEAASNIVVLQTDGRQFGLVVDGIGDTQEIVVKSLGKPLEGLRHFAGATILGDGQVALILDVLGIAQAASVVTEEHAQAMSEMASSDAGTHRQRQSWLLFRSGASNRLGLPLSAVARLEEFSKQSVERSGQHEVVQYRGQIMPLVRVSRLLNQVPDPATDPLQVVVFSAQKRTIGLVVDRIEDISDETVEVQGIQGRSFLLGSAVIQQRVTDILDLQQVMAYTTQPAADADFMARS
jgi:two-component system chemotaxis sensor kinase CheA